MIDFTWTPGVPEHLLVAGIIVMREDIMVIHERTGEQRAGFYGDGWVRQEEGTPVVRWYLEIRERGTFFSLHQKIRLNPAKCSAERLLLAWRRMQLHTDMMWEKLNALWDKIGNRTLFHPYPDDPKNAWTYGRSEEGVWASVDAMSEATDDSDPVLAQRVHELWHRASQWNDHIQMVKWALLRIVSAQLPRAETHPAARVVRIGAEAFHARVDETRDINAPDCILAWRLEPLAEPAEIV